MEFLIPFLIPPAAFAAFMAALYYIYPSPLVHGYHKFGGYLIAGLKRKYIKVNSITYCYYEREPLATEDKSHCDEDGHPKTVLFLHGYTGSKIMWMNVVRYLPKEWRLILVDLPGHGESTFEHSENYNSFGFAEKLHEFVTALDLHNLNLVGCSLGALIAATYAAFYSKSLRSITLMCPPGAHKFPQGVKTEFLHCLEKGKNKVMPRDATEFQEMLDMVLYDSSKFTFHDRMRQALVNVQLPNYPNFEKIEKDLVELDRKESTENIASMAKNIAVPVLIMWGEHDKVCHPSGAHIMSELLSDSRVAMLERCGHAMTMDRPRKCAKLVSDFILDRTG